jgi:hypothetical protein
MLTGSDTGRSPAQIVLCGRVTDTATSSSAGRSAPAVTSRARSPSCRRACCSRTSPACPLVVVTEYAWHNLFAQNGPLRRVRHGGAHRLGGGVGEKFFCAGADINLLKGRRPGVSAQVVLCPRHRDAAPEGRGGEVRRVLRRRARPAADDRATIANMAPEYGATCGKLSELPLIPFEELKRPPFGGYRWAAQMSGVAIPDEIAAALERRWALAIRSPRRLASVARVRPR